MKKYIPFILILSFVTCITLFTGCNKKSENSNDAMNSEKGGTEVVSNASERKTEDSETASQKFDPNYENSEIINEFEVVSATEFGKKSENKIKETSSKQVTEGVSSSVYGELSGWVSYDSVKNRSDIIIEEYKWTESKTSSSSSLSGWTRVGEDYKLQAKGSPTSPSTTKRHESELLKLCNSYSEQKTTGYYIDYYTNISGSNRYYYDYKPSNCNYECHGTATIEAINSAPTVAPGQFCSSSHWRGTNKSSKTAYVLPRPDDGQTALFFLGSPITETVTYYQYQEYEKKYTYKFSRECTGKSYPSSSSGVTISNIQVKYVEK